MTVIVAVLGTLITIQGVKSSAYQNQLELSKYQPPRYVFSIIWTIIYASYAYVWYKYVKTDSLNGIFALNMILNLLWVAVFFGPSSYTQNGIMMSRILILSLLVLTFYQLHLVWKLKLPNRDHNIAMASLGIYASWLFAASFLNFDLRLKAQV